MPLSTAFETRSLVETMRDVRQNPIAAYGTAVVAVAVAVFVRWIFGGQVIEGIPFITYYPAIIVATLIGGLWPGVLALILSAMTAWYFFLLPIFGWELSQREAVSLLLFVAIGGIDVALITLLNAAVDRVLAQEQNVRVLIESAPNGILMVDERGAIKLVNVSMEKLFGYQRSELLGKNIEILVPDRLRDTHQILRESFLQKPETRMMGVGRDLSGRRKDGSEFPVEIGLNPVGSDGNNAVLATVIDISERKRAQEGQHLIIRELQHRTQNLFAVVQAIASRSLDEAKTPAEAKFVLNGRLQALARAYAMLADAAWEGAALSEILDRQFAGFGKRLNVRGCDIVIVPSAVQQFALIIHELATNALKHGALSAADGQVSIEGRIDGVDGAGVFSFLWKETGGPRVSVPTRKGFGSVILLDGAQQFAQNVTIDYAPEGLTYELQISLSAIEASKNLPKRKSSAAFSEVRARSV